MVNNPLAGKPASTKWLIGGGSVVAVYYVYHKYTQSKANAAATAATTDTMTTADPNAVDPSLSYSPDGQSSAYSAASGGAYGVSPSAYLPAYGTPTGVAALPTTNAQWAIGAANLLSQHGYDFIAVDTALGKYIAGSSLTADELSIIQAAIALEGQPPTPVSPPHVAAPTGQTQAKTYPDGFYRVLPSTLVFQLASGTRYPVSPRTWATMNPKPPIHAILASDPINRLPVGKTI